MDFLNTQEKRDRRLVHLPMGRFGEAIEIAKGALFCEWLLGCLDVTSLKGRLVASDDSSYVTVSCSLFTACSGTHYQLGNGLQG